MTTTGPSSPTPGAVGDASIFVEQDRIDGHTIEELNDYLDRDQTPADPTIDSSSECQVALSALMRLRRLSDTVLDHEAEAAPDRGDEWIPRLLALIALEARSGRDIPYEAEEPNEVLEITEGAVRGIIRAAGDNLGGILIGRCELDGDVTVPGAPVTVEVEASALWGTRIADAVADVRSAIYSALRVHTPLNIVSVDVTIRDLHVPRPRAEEMP